jgi:hypothetical protein
LSKQHSNEKMSSPESKKQLTQRKRKPKQKASEMKTVDKKTGKVVSVKELAEKMSHENLYVEDEEKKKEHWFEFQKRPIDEKKKTKVIKLEMTDSNDTEEAKETEEDVFKQPTTQKKSSKNSEHAMIRQESQVTEKVRSPRPEEKK